MAGGDQPSYLAVLGSPTLALGAAKQPRPRCGARMLAFSTVHRTLEVQPEALLAAVRSALTSAERHDLPVLIQFDDWNFPSKRWAGDPDVVEWTSWPAGGARTGPPVRRRVIEWMDGPQPPPMNYESERVRAEVEPKLRSVFELIAEHLERWRQVGRDYLLAGVVLGWESGFYSTVPWRTNGANDSRDLVRTGYAALTARGYAAKGIAELAEEQQRRVEAVFDDLMFEVVADHLGRWAAIAKAAGVPEERTYSHLAGGASLPPDRALFAGTDGRDVPLEIAGRHTTPGFTMTPDWCDPEVLTAAVSAASNDRFACAELEVTDRLRSLDALLSYLEWLSARGAAVICIWGWWHPPSHVFGVRGTPAAAAVERWLGAA